MRNYYFKNKILSFVFRPFANAMTNQILPTFKYNFQLNKQTKFFFAVIVLFLGFSNLAYGQVSSFSTSGSYTVPAGVSIITIECWGAGGGGMFFVIIETFQLF